MTTNDIDYLEGGKTMACLQYGHQLFVPVMGLLLSI